MTYWKNLGAKFRKSFSLPKAGIVVLLLALGTGCSTTYERYTYNPRPASETLETPAMEEGTVTVFASVLGIRTSKERGSFVDIRMRVDNDSQHQVQLMKEDLKLYSADLSQFHVLYTEPSQIAPVPPEESGVFNVGFGFPQSTKPSEVDLTGLSLSWKVKAGDRILRGDTSFERETREEYRNYDPHWYQPYPLPYRGGWYYW